VTVLAAVRFYQLGVARRIEVVRVIHMDAGQANFTMALAAMISAIEVAVDIKKRRELIFPAFFSRAGVIL